MYYFQVYAIKMNALPSLLCVINLIPLHYFSNMQKLIPFYQPMTLSYTRVRVKKPLYIMKTREKDHIQNHTPTLVDSLGET